MAHSEYCQMPRMELYEKAVNYFCKYIRLNVLQGSEYISTKDIELVYVPCQCLFTIIIIGMLGGNTRYLFLIP